MRFTISIFAARSIRTLLVGTLVPLAWSQQHPIICIDPCVLREPQSGPNFLAVALLRWYDANQTASFKVGMNPNHRSPRVSSRYCWNNLRPTC
jgi:hypothetical protein